MHPQFRADQYLLDTATGQVWQLTKFSALKGEPEAWKYMQRLHNEIEMFAWVKSKGFKEADKAATGQPAVSTKPKAQTAPMKLN